MIKYVYLFSEGRKEDKELLGSKGANLCEMTRMGLPVPPGFVISTKACKEFFNAGRQFPDSLMDEYLVALKKVEQQMGKKFGDPENPLLFSVRSGAAISMPGMMDTVLNLGNNMEITEGLAKSTGNPRFAYDTYRRFIQMFADVVLGEDRDKFESTLGNYKKAKGYGHDIEMTAEDWLEIIKKYQSIVDIPEDPYVQLEMAIKAVFSSWYTARAIRYRKYNDIPETLGTGVNVQSMVFGNTGEQSGTGVAFTRNPATGENVFFGEYLPNAEGEDVVAGIRTPYQLDYLQERMPSVYELLDDIQNRLEEHYQDMQDLEFTVEDRKLFILQTRTGKRTAKASVKIAVDMVSEGLIDEREALLRVDAQQMDFFLHPMLDPNAEKTVLAKGLPASPGAATGTVVFGSDEAELLAEKGEKVILVRRETTPEDIHGMKAAQGILTEQGGMTSHAAVVARGMGTCCVAGCSEISIDYQKECFTTKDGTVVYKKDLITLDGTSGEVILGEVPKTESAYDEDFQTILTWADRHRRLKVRANAETQQDASKARELGAEGIGLCRTEHMFFDENRIDVVRQMILAEDDEVRKSSLKQIREFQKQDMKELFKVMAGFPVTIRLLDPPLHEFLPSDLRDIGALAQRLDIDAHKLETRIHDMQELNPMLGFRGCRLSIVYPEITEMQVEAIISAAIEVQEMGYKVFPEIMVPLVSTYREIEFIFDIVKAHIEEYLVKKGKYLSYKLGTMMEVPRACLQSDTIAPMVQFMSFGTNDLTQMTFGYSRDDFGKFLPSYLDQKILNHDPFVVLDQRGVGELIRLAIERARRVNKGLEYGICGEHGGEPRSIKFCHNVGFHYVSCSPFRVPIARIAAAQASVMHGQTR